MIGIDLGTTYSLVAHLVDGVPTLIPNALGDVLTPSVVAIDAEGRVVVGSAARAIAQHDPRSSVQEFKRDMGTPRQHAFGDRLLGAPALSALVLSSLRRDAEAFLGTAVEEAVITVPAYFGDAQRQATRDAGALAGLRVDRVINEPTAAALAYGLHARGRDQRVIVIDLGGGTFDVTVLEILEGVIEVQASAGDVRLGGLDFDQALVSVVAARSGLTTEIRDEPIAARRAKAACERAKHELSTRELVEIAIPGLSYQGRPVDVVQPLTRVDAEAAWQPLLERMRLPILRGLRDVGLKPRDVDEVLLVGGASRMPCVVKLVAEMFDRLPMRHLQPDEAIAKGAAIQAGLMAGDRSLGDLVVTDIAPFSLGVDIAAIHAGTTVTGMFSPILERGTVLPASRSATFSTLQANQTQILLGIYQGEHSLVRDNTKLGELRVDGLPKRPAGDVRLEVRFSYDANAILEVDVEVLGHDRRESLMIEGHPGRMTPGERATALAALQQLKFHPREALPNVTALARGEALFVELRLSARDELQARLAVLRSALERQAFDDIDDARRALLAFIDHYRNEA